MATVTLETTFNKQKVITKLIVVLLHTYDEGYSQVHPKSSDLTDPNSQKRKG